MKKSELVFIPSPGIGHLVSSIEFAKRLLDQDDRFSITFLIINPPSASVATNHSQAQSLAALDTRIKFIQLPHVDPPPPDLFLRSIEKYVTDFIESHKAYVKEAILNRIVSSNNSSVPLVGLVVDMFCSTMIDVANELGLPSYLFYTCNAAFLGFMMLYLPTRHDQVGTEFGSEESDTELAVPSYVNPVPTRVLPSFAFNKEGGYVSFVNHGRKFKEAKGIVVNTFVELESHAVSSFLDSECTPPIYTVGPLLDHKGQSHLRSDKAQSEKIMKWLDDQPPSTVVFLCFGSMGSFGETQLKEIAVGLEKSGQRFLWSVRCASPEDKFAKPSDCINLEEILPQGFLERTKEKGLICGWAPQVEVLGHKAIGGFVSHCGWNSILESLWYGVPIATWPIYAEQQMNAFEMVRDLGLAVEMKLDYRTGGEVVMAGEIEKAVRCVMESDCDEVRKRVQEMSHKSRKAVMNGGSSCSSLGRLIDVMLGDETN